MCCEQKHDIMTDEEAQRERKKPYTDFLKRILKEQYKESEVEE